MILERFRKDLDLIRDYLFIYTRCTRRAQQLISLQSFSKGLPVNILAVHITTEGANIIYDNAYSNGIVAPSATFSMNIYEVLANEDIWHTYIQNYDKNTHITQYYTEAERKEQMSNGIRRIITLPMNE